MSRLWRDRLLGDDMNIKQHLIDDGIKPGIHLEDRFFYFVATFVCPPLVCGEEFCFCHMDYRPWPKTAGPHTPIFIRNLPNGGIPIKWRI